MNNMVIDEGIIKLQKKIGLKSDFFESLLKEDDWSFIIKLHSFIESIVTSLLNFHFNEPKLESIFARLEMSNNTNGKIAFLKATSLLGKEEINFITSLSEIRNKLVHNVKNCNINLKSLINSLDKNQLNNFAIHMRPYNAKAKKIIESSNADKIYKNLKEQSTLSYLTMSAKKDPKMHIWIGAYGLLVEIVNSFYYSDYIKYIQAKDILSEDDQIFS